MIDTVVQTPAVDTDSLPSLLASPPVVIIHFWAPWNGRDRTMDRILQRLISDYAGRIEFRSRDTELGLEGMLLPPETIRNVPALACHLNGCWVETIIGVGDVEEWRMRFNGWLAGGESRPIL